MNKDSAIGIFDSGIGGLTVLKEIRKALPSENLVYLGDTARVPYGTKSPETVRRYTTQNTLFFLERGVKAIVIACNTATAFGLDFVKTHFRVPVLGVIEPGAQGAVKATRSGRIGVIGTAGTIGSKAYERAVKKLSPQADIVAKACPLLVGLVESGFFSGAVVEPVLESYLAEFKKAGAPDTLILGCTHYPLLKKAIGDFLGPQTILVDSAEQTALALVATLKQEGLLTSRSGPGLTEFWGTDSPETMKKLGQIFLGTEIAEVRKAEIS